MNISKKQLVVTIMLGLMPTPMAVTLAQPVQTIETSVISPIIEKGKIFGTTREMDKEINEVVGKLAKDTYIIDMKVADVTGDNSKSNIYLIGHKSNKDAIYADHLTILVQNGATKELITAELQNLGGYEGKLFVGDFNGDGIADVMVNAPTGGSGGMVEHRILSFNGGQPSIIFNHENNMGIQFTGKFVDGFKAQLTNEDYDISTTIDLQGKKDLYVNSQIYDTDGKLLKEVKPISYPIASLEPVDLDGDGVYELKGIQRIIGAYGADTIGNVYSSWKYENNQWGAKSIEVTSFLRNFDRRSPIARPSDKIVVLNELDNNKEITVESGDQIQIKLKETSGTGYKWSLDSFDTSILEFISETAETVENQDNLPGGAHSIGFTLKAKKMGKTEIKLRNFRPWENKEPADGIFSITVNNLPKGI